MSFGVPKAIPNSPCMVILPTCTMRSNHQCIGQCTIHWVFGNWLFPNLPSTLWIHKVRAIGSDCHVYGPGLLPVFFRGCRLGASGTMMIYKVLLYCMMGNMSLTSLARSGSLFSRSLLSWEAKIKKNEKQHKRNEKKKKNSEQSSTSHTR